MQSDAELIKAFQKGDQRAFEALVARYEKPVFGYVLVRVNDYTAAEDITQETFWRVYGALSPEATLKKGSRSASGGKKRRFKWRESKPKGFAGWVFTTARNCCHEWRRDNQTARVHERSLDRAALETSTDQKTAVQQQEAIDKLNHSLEQLPEEYYLVLSLKYQQGMTCAQIAKALGQPLGTVTSALTRAYKLLRQDPDLRAK